MREDRKNRLKEYKKNYQVAKKIFVCSIKRSIKTLHIDDVEINKSNFMVLSNQSF